MAESRRGLGGPLDGCLHFSPYGVLCRITNPIDLGRGELDRPHVLFGVDVLTPAGACLYPRDWRQHDLFCAVLLYLHVVCVAMVGCWPGPARRLLSLLFIFLSVFFRSSFSLRFLGSFLCPFPTKTPARPCSSSPASPKFSVARSQTVPQNQKVILVALQNAVFLADKHTGIYCLTRLVQACPGLGPDQQDHLP